MFKHGGLAEWFKAAVLKTVDVNSVRRFESCVLRQNLASAHDKKAGAFFFALQSRTCFAVGPVPASICARFAPRLRRLQKPAATIWLFVLTIILNRPAKRITFWLCFFCYSYPIRPTVHPKFQQRRQTTSQRQSLQPLTQCLFCFCC